MGPTQKCFFHQSGADKKDHHQELINKLLKSLRMIHHPMLASRTNYINILLRLLKLDIPGPRRAPVQLCDRRPPDWQVHRLSPAQTSGQK